ncbi:MAG: class I SAM-dependent methyltransferase [Bacteroidota bacterium]
MNIPQDYIEKNKASWNQRTDYHVKSEFYKNDDFINGASSLNDIELQLLGDIKGKSLLHLQCHFGQDTLSLARLGAHVTGMDLSDKAIAQAQQLATQININAHFVCCDIYDLPAHLHQQFDIIYTSYGAIGWLPDMDKWAKIIAHFLKPGGKFIIVEFHPVVWMFDENFKEVQYNYFNKETIVELESGTYADREAPIKHESVSWNHSMSEVLNALIREGLSIDLLNEYDYSPYNCFNETVKLDERKYRIKHLGDKIPMVYAIVATKK